MTLKKILFVAGATISLSCVLLSLLPFWKVDLWWIRVWDFPRVQLILLGILGLLVMGVGRGLGYATYRRLVLPIVAVTLVVIGFQGWRILPYTQFRDKEVVRTEQAWADRCFTVMIANVLMTNRDTAPVIDIIERKRPDIVLIVENDQRWSDALADVKDSYPLVVDRPIDNTYGMLFMTGFEDTEIVVRELVEPGIPSVKARIRLPAGVEFVFHGVHPKPPKVGQDTDQRDVELMLVAKDINASSEPVVVAGDLNDVAWSHTTRLFKRIANVLDPRIGRGLFSSFHADYPMLRWPLDHVFHSEQFELLSLDVLPDIGSDHFPVLAGLCHVGEFLEDNREQDSPDSEDLNEMEETISGA